MNSSKPNIVFNVKALEILNEDGEIEVEDDLSGFVRTSMHNALYDKLSSRVHELFCNNPAHLSFENAVTIESNGKDFTIEKCCCEDYRFRLEEALSQLSSANL